MIQDEGGEDLGEFGEFSDRACGMEGADKVHWGVRSNEIEWDEEDFM